MKKFENKTIGIWGIGITGKSALKFLSHKHPNSNFVVTDNKKPNSEEAQFLKKLNTTFYPKEKLMPFLQICDYIVASPGINLNLYQKFSAKFVQEIDCFYHEFNKKIVAITGTLGKTTITHMLAQILKKQGISACCGGNIGVGLFDLIEKQNQYECAVVELSSFQLEHAKAFAPDLAIWTNFYPNHLDRHANIEEYINAKMNIFSKQTNCQTCLLPAEIIKHILPTELNKYKCNFAFFSAKKPTHKTFESFDKKAQWFYVADNKLMHYKNGLENIIESAVFPDTTFDINWIAIYSAITLLNIKVPTKSILKTIEPFSAHRIEFVKTVDGIEYYNDSKATISQSTLAAVEKLKNKKITIILGGISKGVKREEFIRQLSGKIKQAICFGKEAKELYTWCKKFGINSTQEKSLEAALEKARKKTPAGECILFSPAGASFDLYSNYMERGKHFISLVESLTSSCL